MVYQFYAEASKILSFEKLFDPLHFWYEDDGTIKKYKVSVYKSNSINSYANKNIYSLGASRYLVVKSSASFIIVASMSLVIV